MAPVSNTVHNMSWSGLASVDLCWQLFAVVVVCSGTTVVVNVTLEREDEIAGPILAPFFPQVTSSVMKRGDTVLIPNSMKVCNHRSSQ